jgi:hypothetical protein
MKTTLFTPPCLFVLAWSVCQSLCGAADTTPPRLVSASSTDGLVIGLCYSEVMNPAGLNDLFAYQVQDGAGAAAVASVSIRPGNQAVAIHLSRAVTGVFTVEVQDVFDLAGNLIPPGATVAGRVWSTGLAVADIGAPNPAGAVRSCSEGTVEVDVGGRNIGDTADQFTYLYQSRTNDFDVSVRVDGLLYVGHPTAKAGLLVRESLAPGSVFFMAYATPTNGANELLARARQATDQVALDFGSATVGAFPVWLRVQRSGPAFRAFFSRDGQTWEQLGSAQTLPLLPPVLLVGVGTMSHIQGTATTAQYRDFGETPLYPEAVVTIARQPTPAVVEANARASFSVAAFVSGAPAEALRYQWQAEESPGSGTFTNVWLAISTSYSTPFLTPTDSGTRVRVLVFVSFHAPVASDAVTITVGPDVSAPRAVTATGTRSLRDIVVTFSEPLERATAEQPLAYSVPGFAVTNAVLDATGTKVTLALNGRQTPGSTNTVQITGVRDLAGRPLDPDPQAISAPAFILARGFALQELYFGIPGASVAEFRGAAKFPSAPDQVSYAPLLEGPLDAYDFYGTRVSGFLAPTTSGNYHFFVCSDDGGEFWLSTDDEPANRMLLCREPQWMGSRTYTNNAVGGMRNASAPENRSATLFPSGIPLTAGRLYYFEALGKEAWGGDNVSVAWQMPGAPPPADGSLPIASELLAVLAPPGSTVQIVEQPQDIFYQPNPAPGETIHDATFTASTGGYTTTNVGSPQGPWSLNAGSGYWYANGSGLGAPSASLLNSPTFTVPRAGPVALRLTHRYSFEATYDGGQVRLSVNGGPFQPLGTAGFCTHGYAAGSLVGSGLLRGQRAFHGESPAYSSGRLITSAVDLGHFNAGDVLQIQFLASWDQYALATQPNWLIQRVSVTEGECEAHRTFSVRASASVPSEAAQPLRYQWQRDCGSGFANLVEAIGPDYSFVPTAAHLGCSFRCIVATLGMSATSTVARVTLPPPRLQVRREGAFVIVTWNGQGTLQDAPSPTGPWEAISGATNNTYAVRPEGEGKFYRVRVP